MCVCVHACVRRTIKYVLVHFKLLPLLCYRQIFMACVALQQISVISLLTARCNKLKNREHCVHILKFTHIRHWKHFFCVCVWFQVGLITPVVDILWCWQLWHFLVISWTATFIIAYTGWLCPASALVWSAFSIILYYSPCAYSILTNISGLSCLLEVICSAAYFVCSGSSFLLCLFPCAIVFNSIYWICISLHFVFSIYINRKTFLTLFSR